MLHWLKRAANTIANASPGKVRLFVDAADGLYKQKDETGELRVLGNGIKQILKTSTSGLVDTYTITLDDNATRTFTVTNGDDGRSIVSITRTNGNGAPGTTDTYTITYSEAPLTSTFQVYNGADGQMYTDEQAQDAAALMLTAATHVGISVSYDDANNRLAITNTDRGSVAVTNHVGQADPHGQYILETEKGAANGVATLGGDGKVPAIQLPSFVDDVLEFASLGAFPATGETGKIYVALDTNRTYRWSGSAYIEISASPGSTDAVAEGSTNLYFTAQRVRDTVLTGLSLATNATISAADSVLSAFGKLQKQITDHFAAADPHPQYTTDSEATTIANTAVTNHVNAADPHTQYTTDSEATSIANSAVSAHTGQADPHPQYATPAEAAAAAPVQSVAGKQGAVTLTNADVGLGNVRNPVVPNAHTTASQTLNQTLTNVASVTIPANTLQAGDAFEFDVLFSTLVNTTAASNLEVAITLNGTQIALISAAMGTTAVAAPGRGGRAFAKLVFRSVGAAGSAICNGTLHVNNLANFASNVAAPTTINTTAPITLAVQARTSAATTTGVVQFAAIDQAT